MFEQPYYQPVSATTTWFTNAFASLSRLQLACSFDLALSLKLLPPQAGRSADKQTLLWAKQHGLLWNEALCEGAALARRFDLLMWLHRQQSCPWHAPSVALAVMNSHSISMLRWLDAELGSKHEPFAAALQRMQQPPTHFDNELKLRAYAQQTAYVRSPAVLAWLEHNFILELQPCAGALGSTAALLGAVSTLKWLHSRGTLQYDTPQSANNLVAWAAQGGQLAAVRYLHEELHIPLTVRNGKFSQ
jgi:hypothetical protein